MKMFGVCHFAVFVLCEFAGQLENIYILCVREEILSRRQLKVVY